VVQPRTGKGPSWANEPQLRPRTPAENSDEVGVKDGRMNDNPAPPQDALSDLEWMKQRMAKPAVEDSGTTACRLDPLPTTKADMKHVRPCNAIHSTSCHLTQLEIARSLIKRPNTRHHSQNRSALCPEPRFLLHRRGFEGIVQTFWRDFTGWPLAPSPFSPRNTDRCTCFPRR